MIIKICKVIADLADHCPFCLPGPFPPVNWIMVIMSFVGLVMMMITIKVMMLMVMMIVMMAMMIVMMAMMIVMLMLMMMVMLTCALQQNSATATSTAKERPQRST